MKLGRLLCALMVAGGLGCALAQAEPSPLPSGAASTAPLPAPSTAPQVSASPAPSPLPWLEPTTSQPEKHPGDTVLLGADGRLELRECLDYARVTHPRLRAAQARYEQAVGQLRVSQALYVPNGQIIVTRSHTYTQNGGYATPIPGTSPYTILLAPSAQLTYLLGDGGLRSNSVARDRVNLLTYALGWRNEWRQLSQQIELDYLQVLVQKRLLEVQEDSVRMADSVLRQAEGLFRAGRKTRLDVLQAQTDLSGAQAQLTRQQGALARALVTLGADIGAPINEFAILDPMLTNSLPTPPPERYLALALTQRSDVLSYANQIAVQRRQIAVNKTALNPTLNVLLQFGFTGGDFPQFPTWQGGLTLTVPLTQSTNVRGQNLQVEAQIMELLSNTYNLRLSITGDLSRNYLLQQEALRRIVVTTAQEDEAERAYTLAERRYVGGISQYIEVTNARQVLNSARSDRITAFSDCRQAEIQILATMEEAFPLSAASSGAPPASPAPSPSPSPVPAPSAQPAAAPGTPAVPSATPPNGGPR